MNQHQKHRCLSAFFTVEPHNDVRRQPRDTNIFFLIITLGFPRARALQHGTKTALTLSTALIQALLSRTQKMTRPSSLINVKALSAAGMLLAGLSFGANAVTLYYTFTGTNVDGTGSATMLVDYSGDTLTAKVNNTSPILTNTDPATSNIPGIVGFGFDLDPNSTPTGNGNPTNPFTFLDSWTLTAKAFTAPSTFTTITIGSDTCVGCDWIMDDFLDGIRLDYVPQVATGVDGAIYNPLVANDPNLVDGANSFYFTEAILTMTFTQDITSFSDPVIRMRRVGTGAQGSLKLDGTPGVPPEEEPVPEPATLALLGLGLAGLAATRRRRV